MVRIAVCDDVEIYTEKVVKLIKTMPEDIYSDLEIDTFNSADKLMEKLIFRNEYDIYILDIEMPEFNGMELAKRIRIKQEKASIIFLSDHESYVYSVFDVLPLSFVRKICIEKDLVPAVEKAYNKAVRGAEKGVYEVKQTGISFKINYSDIAFIEKSGRKICIHLINGETIKENKNISQIYEELDSKVFLFIDRGIIVNIINIKNIIDRTKIVMINHDNLFISRRKFKEVNQALLDYWGK